MGTIRHIYQNTVDYGLIKNLIFYILLGALVGSIFSVFVDIIFLFYVFAFVIILFGIMMLFNYNLNNNFICNNLKFISIISGILNGMVSVGLELILCCVSKNNIKNNVGSVVVMYFISNIFIIKLIVDRQLFLIVKENFLLLSHIILFSGTSVLVGGYIGPKLMYIFPIQYFKTYVGFIMIILGFFYIYFFYLKIFL